MNPDVKPGFLKPRSVPYALKSAKLTGSQCQKNETNSSEGFTLSKLISSLSSQLVLYKRNTSNLSTTHATHSTEGKWTHEVGSGNASELIIASKQKPENQQDFSGN
eukprot:m.306685 g.306685  ORF g.306685 m.306685 type:complete len:106 (+) comp41496_c0_seq1:192-509(+)